MPIQKKRSPTDQDKNPFHKFLFQFDLQREIRLPQKWIIKPKIPILKKGVWNKGYLILEE